MSRAALIRALAVVLAAGLLGPVGGSLPARAAGANPHLDPGLLPLGCIGCHEGHGVSGSPMLPGAQKGVCLGCHGSRGSLDERAAQGRISFQANPAFIGSALAQPFTHPVDDQGFSRYQEATVTCTSCHSPHRGLPQAAGGEPTGRRKLSPRDPGEFQVELCKSCHGGGPVALAPGDIGRLIDPGNRSYHPLEAPAAERSATVLQTLSGGEINCTDCHGNSDASGPQGPHGSAVQHLLKAGYVTVDGAGESPATYSLCYRCHDRQAVLERSRFPEHKKHVEGENVSCATCHNPHGSVDNRALIRFGNGVSVPGVAPSARTGRLEFVSTSPGSGACYLTCHGEDHRPETYGGFQAIRGPDPAATGLPPAWPEPDRPLRRPQRPPPRQDPDGPLP